MKIIQILIAVLAAAFQRPPRGTLALANNNPAPANAPATGAQAKTDSGAEKELAQIKRDEKLIAQKMAAGLTRDQAVASIKHQRDYDAAKKN